MLLQRITATAADGSLENYRLFVTGSPRLGNQGSDNTAWLADFRGRQMLFARREGHSLALGCSAPWLARSVGFVGVSDGRTDIKAHGRMTCQYDKAEHGHVAFTGEVDLHACGGKFILAMGLDRSPDAAALNLSLSLTGAFGDARNLYIKQWSDWQKSLNQRCESSTDEISHATSDERGRPDSSRPRVNPVADVDEPNLYRTSTMVLKTHRSKRFAGASVASLAVPWGDVRSADDPGGYHLVWPRDMVEESLGFLAIGAFDETRQALNYLKVTQNPDGGWAQNVWLDGTVYAAGVQLDEAALPILLVDFARRESALSDEQLRDHWPMIRAAAGFLIRSGPSTGQGRWENAPGLQPYTLATIIAALVVAAKFADRSGEPEVADYLFQTADLWNDQIEDWTYAIGTSLAEQLGLDGYYVRLAPPPGIKALNRQGKMPTERQARDLPVDQVVSCDALALVRFGLRAADDPRILNTVKAIDAVLKADLPAGPCWRRYNGGYYGESDEGDPFSGAKDKHGHGRAWPLLTGERGHYELAAGRPESARQLLETMGGLCSQIGFLPEQVWDMDDLPSKNLFKGRPAGSAMPLAWAHSEYIRLLRSVRDGKVFDLPADVHERYVLKRTGTNLALWRFDCKSVSLPAGRTLRVETLAPAIVFYSVDGWKTSRETTTRRTGIGLHFVDLPTADLHPGDHLVFTFRWPEADDKWQGEDFFLTVEAADRKAAT